MHFAGSIISSESVTYPLKYYSNNTTASQSLIECCVNSDVEAFIFSSTAAVYGNPDKIPVAETAPTIPITPYGWSMLMTEWMLCDVSSVNRMRYAVLRYFNVAGADIDGRSGQVGPNSSHLIRVACELATERRAEMSIFGTDYDTPDGTCIRDFIHVSDLATAHVSTLHHLLENRKNLILNCGYGHGFSVREVLNVVEELVKRSLAINAGARRDGDATELISDSSLIRDVLDWQPHFNNLEIIVKTALDWEARYI